MSASGAAIETVRAEPPTAHYLYYRDRINSYVRTFFPRSGGAIGWA